MSGVGLRSSCRSLIENLIFYLLHVSIYCLLFIADNQKDFLTNAYVHGLDTRNVIYIYLL